ncbi:hypothetical protein ABZX12_41050 [Kribbella sp. NPDC003505]|uniref:hypothetical protein n=1 Tax=Kribbella sp. NPDC003505 TaxID=3154448 RepID=UPI0033B49FF7
MDDEDGVASDVWTRRRRVTALSLRRIHDEAGLLVAQQTGRIPSTEDLTSRRANDRTFGVHPGEQRFPVSS